MIRELVGSQHKRAVCWLREDGRILGEVPRATGEITGPVDESVTIGSDSSTKSRTRWLGHARVSGDREATGRMSGWRQRREEALQGLESSHALNYG